MRRASARHTMLLAATSMGISTALFLGCLAVLTSSTHLTVYHLSGRSSALFIPVLVDVLGVATLCFAVLRAARSRPGAHRIVWSFLLCFFPWLVTRSLAVVAMKPSHGVSLLLLGLGLVGFVALGFGRSARTQRIFGHAQSIGEVVLMSCGVVGVGALLQVVWLGVQASHLNDQRVSSQVQRAAGAAPHGRVVWILLDELAYRQLFEHRLAGLELPAFDRLRDQSTIFTDVQPAGIRTQVVVPALLTGVPVDQIRSSDRGLLSLHTAAGWQAFDQRDTVFADADRMGYETAVVGWFNPYCRILPSVLDSCYWTNHSAIDGLFPRHRVALNLVQPAELLWAKAREFFHLDKGAPAAESSEGEEHLRDFVRLNAAADTALSDQRNTFVFLHMPVPHPSGIWDRKTGQFAIDHSSYVDNLALADSYLNHVRMLLEESGQWDSTTVVIIGDHGWRTKLLWESSAAWNLDDQAASNGGRFDPRPAYMVKLPYQQTTAVVAAPFPATRTRALLDQLLSGTIRNAAQLQSWADGEASLNARTAVPAVSGPS